MLDIETAARQSRALAQAAGEFQALARDPSSGERIGHAQLALQGLVAEGLVGRAPRGSMLLVANGADLGAIAASAQALAQHLGAVACEAGEAARFPFGSAAAVAHRERAAAAQRLADEERARLAALSARGFTKPLPATPPRPAPARVVAAPSAAVPASDSLTAVVDSAITQALAKVGLPGGAPAPAPPASTKAQALATLKAEVGAALSRYHAVAGGGALVGLSAERIVRHGERSTIAYNVELRDGANWTSISSVDVATRRAQRTGEIARLEAELARLKS